MSAEYITRNSFENSHKKKFSRIDYKKFSGIVLLEIKIFGDGLKKYSRDGLCKTYAMLFDWFIKLIKFLK